MGNVQGHSTVVRCLNAGLVDAYEYDFDFSIIGGVVGHIDGDGVIRQVMHKVKPDTNAAQVLEALQA